MEAKSDQDSFSRLLELIQSSSDDCITMIYNITEATNKKILTIEENQNAKINSITSIAKKNKEEFDSKFTNQGTKLEKMIEETKKCLETSFEKTAKAQESSIEHINSEITVLKLKAKNSVNESKVFMKNFEDNFQVQKKSLVELASKIEQISSTFNKRLEGFAGKRKIEFEKNNTKMEDLKAFLSEEFQKINKQNENINKRIDCFTEKIDKQIECFTEKIDTISKQNNNLSQQIQFISNDTNKLNIYAKDTEMNIKVINEKLSSIENRVNFLVGIMPDVDQSDSSN